MLSDGLVWVLAVLTLAAFVQGFLGFGYGLISMGLLCKFGDLGQMGGVVNLTFLLLNLVILWPLRKWVVWRLVWPVVLIAIPALVGGVYALVAVDRTWMIRLLGGTILALSIGNFLNRREPSSISPWWSVPSGIGLGALTGAFNMGGPVIAAYVYSHPFPRHQLISTAQVIFMATLALRVPLASVEGMISGQVLQQAAMAAPIIVLVTRLGVAASRRLTRERFTVCAWSAIGLMGIYLILTA